jgi:hypothetical protein
VNNIEEGELGSREHSDHDGGDLRHARPNNVRLGNDVPLETVAAGPSPATHGRNDQISHWKMSAKQ